MENRRLILLCALGIILFFIWEAWQRDYSVSDPVPPVATAEVDGIPSGQSGATTTTPPVQGEGVPVPVPGAAREDAADAPAPAVGSEGNFLPSATEIHVRTDTLDVVIDTYGGDLREVTLLGYPISQQGDSHPYSFISEDRPYFFIAQSGLVSPAENAPTHHTRYQTERTQYQLPEGSDSVSVPMTWTGPDGHEVTKIYTFTRGSYEIDLKYVVDNGAGEPWTVSPYLQFWRTPTTPINDPRFMQSFLGGGIHKALEGEEGYKYEKIEFESLYEQPLAVTQTGGWIGMVQHYFIAAVIPPADRTHRFYAKPRKLPNTGQPAYVDGYVGPQHEVAAGATETIATRLYVGPKLQDLLPEVAPGLALTVDYGIWTIIAQPIFWVLSEIHDLVGNWGWSIVLLTLLIKLIFYKLSETQYRSMGRMKKFTPRIQQLKERHADDREGMQKAMMDLYRKEGFNPLGGCWPMLVQFPVFIALYWVLRASVELREAPFILWINDLSSPDPYYVLPILFGVSMFLQQKLSGSAMAMDEVQRKVMMVMPLGLAVFFTFFPAGLVLYWLVSNLIGITQQWWIMRKMDNEEVAHA